MPNTKANVKIDADVKAEHRLPFQPVVTPTIEEQIVAAAIKNSSKVLELSTDKNGNILVDKKLHPEVYDWAANG